MADTIDLGSIATSVQVQVLSSAPKFLGLDLMQTQVLFTLFYDLSEACEGVET